MPQSIEPLLNTEARVILAIQAIRQGSINSVKAAAAAYSIPRTTLRDRIYGTTSRRDCIPNSQRLTSLEELVIVRYILDLRFRSDGPRLASIHARASRD